MWAPVTLLLAVVLSTYSPSATTAFHTRWVPHARHIAAPSAAQLAWMDLELGGNICFGIGAPGAPWYSPLDHNCCCNLTAPPASAFNSTPNLRQWVSALRAMGAKYSVLPASGGCGYALWPSRARFPDGTRYNYSVWKSPRLGTSDIMRDYVLEMRAGGIGTGVYFQLYYDYWAGFLHGKMQPNGPGAPKLTAQQYFDLAIKQLEEVWGDYGNHTELWYAVHRYTLLQSACACSFCGTLCLFNDQWWFCCTPCIFW
jgi:hypothetical protein